MLAHSRAHVNIKLDVLDVFSRARPSQRLRRIGAETCTDGELWRLAPKNSNCPQPSVLGRTAAARGFRSRVECSREGGQVIQAVAVCGVRHCRSDRLHERLAADGDGHADPFGGLIELSVRAEELGRILQVRDGQPDQPRSKLSHCFGEARQGSIGTQVDGCPTRVQERRTEPEASPAGRGRLREPRRWPPGDVAPLALRAHLSGRRAPRRKAGLRGAPAKRRCEPSPNRDPLAP